MGKSIIEKLNLMRYSSSVVVNRPNDTYLPELKEFSNQLPTAPVDLIFVFVTSMAEFEQIVSEVILKQLLLKDGVLFVAYPKKGNKSYPTFVHRDEIFPTLQVDDQDGYIKNSTLKFNRMVSLDETFTVTGMKNVERTTKSISANSARVEDYIQFIPAVEVLLENSKEAKRMFDQLTPGYKKDWARYIFSAKQATTQEKRKAEMIDILEKGFKSKELYRQFLAN
ncbi:YdeI/OmpD-associated family protein [Enterococcus crotali]|uniref:YdeI/OmpD-associated family protein n=1 Tax=Enterococcus crotali TaxID=1453587 RepID=UPI0004708485|nr:YdeI/OmpD-associated family protein [Enterococcus crotali]